MRIHSSSILKALCVAALAVASAPADAADSAFTYQGQLKQGGAPYDGSARFEFSLWDADRSGQELAPRVILELDVIDGLFSVPLDFGTEPFAGEARWLEITVDTGGGSVALSPRQEVTPAPYAITALKTVGVDGHSLDGANAGPTDAVFVDSSGKVGIGTTSPHATLEVNGSVQASGLKLTEAPVAGHVLTSDDSGNGTWQAPPAGSDSLWLTNRDDIYFSAGNVGIGTSTPATSLDVAGVIAVDGFQMGERVPAGHVLTADTNGVGTWQHAPSSSDPVWNQSGGNIYYDGGNVGIGMTNPSKPLDVIGDARVFNGNLHLGAEGADPYIELMSDEYSNGTTMRLKSLDGVGFAVTDSVDTPRLVVETSGNVGIGTTNPLNPLHVISTNTSAIHAENPNELNAGELGSEYGGVWGGHTGVGGKGVYGEATAEGGAGVFGVAWAQTGTNYGVRGESAGALGRGVYGQATGNSGRGVYGEVTGTHGYGVYGKAFGGSGVYGESDTVTGGKGVEGYSQSDTGYAVYGFNEAGSGNAIAVYGESASPTGYGGYFEGRGYFSGNVGISTTTPVAKVHIEQAGDGDAFRVDDESGDASPFVIRQSGKVGIGIEVPHSRVHVVDYNMTARLGNAQIGTYETAYHGVSGTYAGPGGNATGHLGYASSFAGSTDFFGAFGKADTGGRNFGVYGSASGGTLNFAGYFSGDVKVLGNVEVTGDLSKGGGSFKIDHPLDPENKYLRHSFVESPDMMNVYNGNVVLRKNGEAHVTMPDYFATLNRDFRYQLTCIGEFAPVYIAEKMTTGQFRIAGGSPGMEVSWQVTGIRQDPWANANRIQVEEDKSDSARGTYLHPAAYGPGAKGETDRFEPEAKEGNR